MLSAHRVCVLQNSSYTNESVAIVPLVILCVDTPLLTVAVPLELGASEVTDWRMLIA